MAVFGGQERFQMNRSFLGMTASSLTCCIGVENLLYACILLYRWLHQITNWSLAPGFQLKKKAWGLAFHIFSLWIRNRFSDVLRSTICTFRTLSPQTQPMSWSCDLLSFAIITLSKTNVFVISTILFKHQETGLHLETIMFSTDSA